MRIMPERLRSHAASPPHQCCNHAARTKPARSIHAASTQPPRSWADKRPSPLVAVPPGGASAPGPGSVAPNRVRPGQSGKPDRNHPHATVPTPELTYPPGCGASRVGSRPAAAARATHAGRTRGPLLEHSVPWTSGIGLGQRRIGLGPRHGGLVYPARNPIPEVVHRMPGRYAPSPPAQVAEDGVRGALAIHAAPTLHPRGIRSASMRPPRGTPAASTRRTGSSTHASTPRPRGISAASAWHPRGIHAASTQPSRRIRAASTQHPRRFHAASSQHHRRPHAASMQHARYLHAADTQHRRCIHAACTQHPAAAMHQYKRRCVQQRCPQEECPPQPHPRAPKPAPLRRQGRDPAWGGAPGKTTPSRRE